MLSMRSRGIFTCQGLSAHGNPGLWGWAGVAINFGREMGGVELFLVENNSFIPHLQKLSLIHMYCKFSTYIDIESTFGADYYFFHMNLAQKYLFSKKSSTLPWIRMVVLRSFDYFHVLHMYATFAWCMTNTFAAVGKLFQWTTFVTSTP